METSYIVYILLSRKDGKLYVGCTSSLRKRLQRHIDGEVPATKDRRPLDLLYYEVIDSKLTAFQKERYYKSLWSARFKKSIKLLNSP